MSIKGFSLIEVMIALGILSVGVLATATLVDTSHHSVSTARYGTRMAHLAQGKMEELQAQRPMPITGSDEIEGIPRKWSVAQQSPRLWVVTVEVASPDLRDKPFVLERVVFY